MMCAMEKADFREILLNGAIRAAILGKGRRSRWHEIVRWYMLRYYGRGF